MMLINKNSVNECMLTLAEKTTLTNVYYLVELTNDSTKVVKYFIAPDSSSNKYRYNLLQITEDTVENLTQGVVSLTVGDGRYKIYEQASSTNLDPTGLNVVEIGKYTCYEVATDLAAFTGEQTTYTEFNG